MKLMIMQKLPFDLKVGDYCTAYSKGIHKVVSIEYPTQRASTALVNLVAILDTKLNPSPARKSSCDVAWCRKINVNEYLEHLQNSHKSQLENVRKLLV
jgi:hypothetical protein